MIALILALVYTGPLADRRVAVSSDQFTLMMFTDAAELGRRLNAHGSISVLAPGSAHLGYGIKADPLGMITAFRFNLRLANAAHWSSLGDALRGELSHNGLFANPGQALAWSLDALRTLGYAPPGNVPSITGERKTWPQLVAEWRTLPDFDPEREAELLARWAAEDAVRLDAYTAPLPEPNSVEMQPLFMPWPTLKHMAHAWPRAIPARGPDAARIAELAERWQGTPLVVLDPETDGAGICLTGVFSDYHDGWVIRTFRFNLHAMDLALEVEAQNRPLSKRGSAAAIATSSAIGLPNIIRTYRWLTDELAAEGVEHIPLDSEFGHLYVFAPYRRAQTFMEEGRHYTGRVDGSYDPDAFSKRLAEVRALP